MKRHIFVRRMAVAIVVGALAVSATVPALAQRLSPAHMLTRADLNKDGQVTKAEFQQARLSLFDRLDRNRDGYLDSSDMPRRLLARNQIGEDLQELMQAFDRNGDGRVGLEEFAAGPSYVFASADTDGNGVIDATELQIFRQKVEAFRR